MTTYTQSLNKKAGWWSSFAQTIQDADAGMRRRENMTIYEAIQDAIREKKEKEKAKEAEKAKAEDGKDKQEKAACVQSSVITYTQAYQAKQASLQKQATLIGRGINSLFGHDTWVGRTFGESPETAAENFYKSQLPPGYEEKMKADAAEYDAKEAERIAAINARIDAGLAAADKRLAEGKGITQQPGYQVAKTQAKPKAQTAPPPPKKQTQMSGQQASQELIKGNRTPEAQKADKSYTAAIRRRDGAGGKR